MNNADKQIRILHLSDIHLGTTTQAQCYFTQLATDLTQNLNVKLLNYLVISGDIANRSTEEEYEAAFELVDKLVKRYGLDPNRIVIVPGNHDLNWELSETAYPFVSKRKLPNPLPEGRYIDAGSTGALICDENEYKKRFDYFSDHFYKKIYNKPYPQEYDQQAILYPCLEDKILFLGLNSCWEIDHEYKNRAGIHPNAITNALEQILSVNYNDWLKIAIWHHPVNGSESMKNMDFLEQLAVSGFQVGIHGHIHEAKDENFQYDTRRGLRIIAAGTFGAPAKEQITGIPLQYNLLTLDPNSGMLTIETRKKEKADGAWSADARWGDKNNPMPRYDIKLRYGTGSKTDNSSSQPKASTQDNRPNPGQSIFDGNIHVGRDISVGNITQIYGFGTTKQPTNPTENPPLKRTILILASSPIDTARLRLDKEAREIDEGLRRAQKREQFTLQQKWAVRPDDLRRTLLDFHPQIVHFSGHGTGGKGLILENDAGEVQLVPTNALANLFKLFASRGVECVVLNACYAEVQAEAISQYINYVVGMSDEISDRAALKFAVGFYDALGAGWSYEDAFNLGCSAIALEGISEELTPVLKKKDQFKVENSVDELVQQVRPFNLEDNPKKDFNRLYDLLIERNWKEANAETHCLILRISKKKHLWQLDKRTIKRFPYDTLRTIDELWIQFSEKEFGFSIQKEIYRECFERFGALNYNLFGERVGWKSNKGWHTYVNYDVSTPPRGHFPKPPQLFNRENTLKGCFIPPLAISFIVSIFLLLFNQPIIVPVLALIIGFLIALFSFIIHTSSYLEGLEWITSLTSKLEECEQYLNNE